MKSKLSHPLDYKFGVNKHLCLQGSTTSIPCPSDENSFFGEWIWANVKRFIGGLVLALIFCVPTQILADSITATITVDNGYGFGFGDINGIFSGQYYGGIDNCSPQAIFNSCYVFVPPDNPNTDNGPEIYNITANWTNYLYIVAWSDDAGLQGTAASFTDFDTGITVTTSPAWPWQVFATGNQWTPNCSNIGSHGPPLTGFPYAINNQIPIANAGSGGPGTSGTWIGNTPTPNGRLDFSGQFNGNTYSYAVPSCIAPGATWMEYNPEPGNSSVNPFAYPSPSSIPNYFREYLIYRIGPVGQIFTTTNTCTNSCITIINPNDITVTTCSNSLPVTYLAHAIDSCCSSYTLTGVPASGFNFPLGTTIVTSTVTDTCGHTNSCSFTVTVIQDTSAPIVYGIPVNFILCVTNGCGVMPDVTSEVQAVTATGGKNVVVTQNIPPGTVLCNNTNVIFTVTDACGDATNCTVPCILNTNPPAIISFPPDIIICTNATGCATMPDVTWEIQASPSVFPITSITQSIPPGTIVCNDTNVIFTVTDTCGDATNCTVPCILIDCGSNCIYIQCWTNIVLTSCTNLPVDYYPAAADACCTNWLSFCNPPSGSIFDAGTTQTVTFSVLDACGNSNDCTFTVTVNFPTNYLQVQSPGNIQVYSCTNVPVTYPPLVVTDPCCGTNWYAVYDTPSGTTFAPNTHTLVNWYLYDCTSGTNFAAAGSFLVSVVCTNCCEGLFTNYTVTVVEGSNYLADCLCQGSSNTLADVLPSVPAGTEVYFWNISAGAFDPPDTFTTGAWHPGTEPMVTGQGFLLVSFTNQYPLTIYGTQPECGPGCAPVDCFSPTVLVGDFGIEPNPADFCDLFCCPPAFGTGVQVWNATTQSFTTYTYKGFWSPTMPPALPVGYSEFVSVDKSACLGSTVMQVTKSVTNQISNLSMSWATSGLPANFWQPQYSTDLVHWATFSTTNMVIPPFIINETGNFYLGTPYQFYRLASTNTFQTH